MYNMLCLSSSNSTQYVFKFLSNVAKIKYPKNTDNSESFLLQLLPLVLLSFDRPQLQKSCLELLRVSLQPEPCHPNIKKIYKSPRLKLTDTMFCSLYFVVVEHQLTSPILTICEFKQKRNSPLTTTNSFLNYVVNYLVGEMTQCLKIKDFIY